MIGLTVMVLGAVVWQAILRNSLEFPCGYAESSMRLPSADAADARSVDRAFSNAKSEMALIAPKHYKRLALSSRLTTLHALAYIVYI